MNNLLIKRARVEDAEVILNLQRLSYLREAEIYNNKSIPPLTQTLEEITAEFDTRIFLKATLEGKIVGSVRAYLAEGVCHIGRLVVHPDVQNKGVGTRLMNEIETCFDKAQLISLSHAWEREISWALSKQVSISFISRVPTPLF